MQDFPLRKIDHVRFFVGNARQSAFFYRNAFGFDVVAYAGLETKVRHEAGYVLRQGGITFVLVSPLRPQHPDVQRLVLHGDGVSDIALQVDDVREAYNAANVEIQRLRVVREELREVKFGQIEVTVRRSRADIDVAAASKVRAIVGIERTGSRVRVRVAGTMPIVAEVTPAAMSALGLAAGTQVWAAVKATEVKVHPA